MTTREAVAARILNLCDERRTNVNALANFAGIPPSTVKSILYGKSHNPGIVTIKILCDALETDLPTFFDSPEFRELEQEIK